MTKPTIFFSHSSIDQKPLARLKEAFLKKTGGSLEIFLSSDGQSIPLGRNWVHTVEEALNIANIMVVFVSPSSTRSSWLFFESGFAYSKGLRVVPVGFLGADLATIPPPLSLLQGFNISSEAGLNNLIAITNKVFNHSHVESFTRDEYLHICEAGISRKLAAFGPYSSLVDEVRFYLEAGRDFPGSAANALDKIYGLFSTMKLDCQRQDNRLDVQGMSFVAQAANGPDSITVSIEGAAADYALPIAEAALRVTCTNGVAGKDLVIDFVRDVSFVRAPHRQSGRLVGSEVKLAPKQRLQYRDLTFNVSRHELFGSRSIQLGAPFIGATLGKDEIPLDQISELIALLFDRQVLFLNSASEAQ